MQCRVRKSERGAEHEMISSGDGFRVVWLGVCQGETTLTQSSALLSFSAAAWKGGARDTWIGWDFRHHQDRLHLIANNVGAQRR